MSDNMRVRGGNVNVDNFKWVGAGDARSRHTPTPERRSVSTMPVTLVCVGSPNGTELGNHYTAQMELTSDGGVHIYNVKRDGTKENAVAVERDRCVRVAVWDGTHPETVNRLRTGFDPDNPNGTK